MNSLQIHIMLLVLALVSVVSFSTPGNAVDPRLNNASFNGITDIPVTLEAGVWEGRPFVEGGASRLRIGLIHEFQLHGDLNSDGAIETIAFLWQSSGGSGTLTYMALMEEKEGALLNTSTVFLGDRVQIRGGRIAGSQIVLDLVQSGPDDAACCPSQLVTRTWTTDRNRLNEEPMRITGRLTPEIFGNATWHILSLASMTEELPEKRITLAYADGKISGSGGCNNYSATVMAGKTPGEISIGPIIATRKACPDKILIDEHAFFRALESTMKFSFMNTRLLFIWLEDGSYKTMLLARQQDI